MYAYIHVCKYTCSWRLQRPEDELDPLEPSLKMVLSCVIEMGAKPRSSEREAISLNHEATSPVLRLPLVSWMVLFHIPTLDRLKQISGVLSFHQKNALVCCCQKINLNLTITLSLWCMYA